MKLALVIGLLGMAATQAARADAIPYPNAGTYNTTTYSFQAASSGHVVAYLVGGFGAGDDNQVGLLVNGVLSNAGFGLDNHTTSAGTSFDFGAVNAGDTLTFVMRNFTVGADVYSDPSLNGSYDNSGVTAHNHVYSTAYTATSPLFAGVPAGTYVAFEDLPFPGADYNYDDASFVFTNVSAVPEPAGAWLMLAGVWGVAAIVRRRRG